MMNHTNLELVYPTQAGWDRQNSQPPAAPRTSQGDRWAQSPEASSGWCKGCGRHSTCCICPEGGQKVPNFPTPSRGGVLSNAGSEPGRTSTKGPTTCPGSGGPCPRCNQCPCICCPVCACHPCKCLCPRCFNKPCICCKKCGKYPCACPDETTRMFLEFMRSQTEKNQKFGRTMSAL